MITLIIVLIFIIILFEVIITIIGYNIIKKMDTISEEPLLENISKLGINKSTSNSDNYIIIKGIIFNDKFTIDVNLLVDSGANRSLLKSEILQKIGIFKKLIPMTYGSGETSSIKVYDAYLELNKKSYLIEFGELCENLNKFEKDFVGILGTDFLKSTNSYIDYKNNLLICPDI